MVKNKFTDMASTSQDMEDLQKKGRLYRFMNGPMTMVMRAVFATVYCRSDTQNGSLTLKQCLKYWRDNKKTIFKDRKELKNFFISSVVKKVENVKILKAKLDISFYYTAITEICHIVYKSLPNEIKDLLAKVKSERNLLFHNNSPISKPIEEYLNDFENMCTELMNTVEKKFGGEYIGNARPNINAVIKKIRGEKLNSDQYEAEQRKFFENMEAKFIRDSQAVLHARRDFGSSVDPFVKLISQKGLSRGTDYRISDVFVAPVLSSGNEKVDYKDILTTLDDVGQPPGTVIVSGQGGCGKSTLCHIIFEQWRDKGSQPPTIEGLSSIDLIIYVEMKLTTYETLLDFLRNHYLMNPTRDISDEEVLTLLNSFKVLFVIDGYDEKRAHGDSFLKILAPSLPKSRFILTTRHENKKECEELFRSHINWDLIGFETPQRNQFASNIFKLVEKDATIISVKLKKFKSYLGTRAPCLEAHMKLPLTLALLIFLWLENYSNLEVMNRIRTASQLFFQLFKMLREKLLNVRTNLKTGGNPSRDDVDDVICLLHEKAFEQLKAGQLLVLTDENQKVIEKTCKNERINPTEILSAFLVCDSNNHVERERQTNTLMSLYSFFHRSQMEYYSARSVSQNLSTSRESLGDYFDEPERHKYRETFIFLAGCLKQDDLLTKHCADLVKLCKTVVDDDDFNYWFSLLNETESEDSKTCEQYDETMKKEIILCLPKTSWKLEVKTLVSGLNLLASCPHLHIDELILNFPSNDGLKNMRGVQPSLERLKHARVARCKEPRTNLYLDFGGHSHDSINYLADPLEYFGSWCKVMEFTGRIREDSVERLLQCTNATVKVKNLATFNKLAAQSSSMKNLDKLSITVTFPKNDIATADPQQFRHKTAKISINFPKLIDNDVQKTIQFIKDASKRSRRFHHVTISGRLEYGDGVEVVRRLQEEVSKKVFIESEIDLTKEEEKTLIVTALEKNKGKGKFKFEWNGEEL